MAATEGHFRVLPGRDGEEWLLLEVESADPTYVPRKSAPGLAPGNRIRATLDWAGEEPAVADWERLTDTRFRFIRTGEPIFEAARTCFEAARSAGDAMNAKVTRDTDGRPNGVVYTFAAQPGQRDLFAEFRDGEKPLEPLVDRASEGEEPPFSVWVLDPEEPFVVVFIVLDPDGLLAETMADTYL